jgi:hypothetical protein
MKTRNKTRSLPIITLGAALAGLAATLALPASAVDLLQRYPTTLTAGMLQPERARPWQFTPNDIFHVSKFHLEVGQQLKVETGPADLGIGHGTDGAVWAILIPVQGGRITAPNLDPGQELAHVWLRFHPKVINELFPPDSVSPAAETSVVTQMRAIASGKFRSSCHVGMNAMIPDPKDIIVDADTKAGPRRFFAVDTRAKTAQYEGGFERQPVRLAATAPRGDVVAPKVIRTSPTNGATDVDPAITEITVTFDQDMGKGFSWTGGGPEYPASPEGQNVEWRGKRTCVLPVKLEPGHHYRVGINSRSYRNFCSVSGQSVEPTSISFTTK